MKRRTFLSGLGATVTVTALSPALVAGSCGSQDTDTDTDTGTDTDTDPGTDTDVGTDTDTDSDTGTSAADCSDGASGPSDSHNHMVTLTGAQAAQTTDLTLTSTGGSHDHTVVITAAELATLRADGSVTVSSNDTHAHTWTITC